jgi:hypothetical protein
MRKYIYDVDPIRYPTANEGKLPQMKILNIMFFKNVKIKKLLPCERRAVTTYFIPAQTLKPQTTLPHPVIFSVCHV